MLNPKNHLPLYIQLANLIRAKMQESAWVPGEQIPTENELCDQYQVSRITVRQAVAELVQEGYLERYPGRGTFVTEPRIEQRISRLTGFTQDMEARGKHPGAKVLQFEIVKPPFILPWAHRLRDEENLILLKRLRLADGEPLAVEISHLSYSLCAGILEENLEDRSLYALLEETCDIIPSRAGQQWTAVACPMEEAKLLHIRRGAPVLHIYRSTYNQHDQPFEWVESYYRGDKYIFQAEMHNEANGRR